MQNILLLLPAATNPLPSTQISAPPNVVPFYQPTTTRKTSRYCPGATKAAKRFSISAPPPPRNNKCSASHCTPPSSLLLALSLNIFWFSVRMKKVQTKAAVEQRVDIMAASGKASTWPL
jgi:hypothetical protein